MLEYSELDPYAYMLERSKNKPDGLLADINNFIEACMTDNEGNPVEQADIHRIWHKHIDDTLQRGLYPGILAPFGHGKSVQVSVAKSLMLLAENNNTRGRIVSASDIEAKKRLASVKAMIENEDSNFRKIFTDIRPSKNRKWSDTQIYLERTSDAPDPSLDAFSILSGVMGSRVDWTIFDDAVDLRNAIQQPSLRKKVIEAFKNQWLTRIEPHGFAIYIGTIWHVEDLTNTIINDELGMPVNDRRWNWLIMSVSEDLKTIECRYTNAA